MARKKTTQFQKEQANVTYHAHVLEWLKKEYAYVVALHNQDIFLVREAEKRRQPHEGLPPHIEAAIGRIRGRQMLLGWFSSKAAELAWVEQKQSVMSLDEVGGA